MGDTLSVWVTVTYHPIMLFFWGSCLGSFSNVVMYRYPLGRSVVHPGSACPSCGKSIAFYDNIPILGWLWLLGKCRQCKTPISPRYPLFEALFGTIPVVAYFIYPDQPLLGFALGNLMMGAIVATVIFEKCRRIPPYLWAWATVNGSLWFLAQSNFL